MSEYFKTNQQLWDELTEINSKSRMYDLESFLRGGISLKRLEQEELHDIKDKSLLHLQCHFGMDTLSWARLGATVTGVDFSPRAISLAKEISQTTGTDARFICSNIYDLHNTLHDQFDVVFTSYGVLCWLPDLEKWGEIISSYLKPGGIFYIIEFHPFFYVFENESNTIGLKLRDKYSYFHCDRPVKWEPNRAYADRSQITKNPSYEWHHSLSDIINSLTRAGLALEYIHEFPYCGYDVLPSMKQGDDGWWRLDSDIELPMMFSIRAVKKPGEHAHSE